MHPPPSFRRAKCLFVVPCSCHATLLSEARRLYPAPFLAAPLLFIPHRLSPRFHSGPQMALQALLPQPSCRCTPQHQHMPGACITCNRMSAQVRETTSAGEWAERRGCKTGDGDESWLANGCLKGARRMTGRQMREPCLAAQGALLNEGTCVEDCSQRNAQQTCSEAGVGWRGEAGKAVQEARADAPAGKGTTSRI